METEVQIKNQHLLGMETTEVQINNHAFSLKNKRGWLVTFCTFCIILPVTGILSSFGVMLVELQREYPDLSDTKAGWIGSLAFGIMFGSSPLSTGLFKRYSHRIVATVGVLMCCAGLVASSFAHNVNFLFVSYSLVFGIGSNFVDNTSLHLIGLHFPRKNSARATCFATLGWSVGALSMNPMAEILCQKYGWRWTYRVFAAFTLVVGLAVITFEPRTVHTFTALKEECYKEPVDKKPELEVMVISSGEEKKQVLLKRKNHQTTTEYIKLFMKALQAPGILLWFFGNISLNLSLIFPFVNMVKFMTTIGISLRGAAFILLCVGIGDFIGRFTSTIVGDHLPFPSIYVYPIFSSIMAAATCSLVVADTYVHLIIYAIVIGVCTGIVNSMLFKATMDLFGSKILAESWTISLLAAGIGVMVGPTVAGLSYDKTGSFEIAFYISTGFFLCALLLTLAIPYAQKKAGWRPEPPEKNGHVMQETVGIFATPRGEEIVHDYITTL
ncbi:monocarboxylate transporter 2-like [Anneissia japonica]|uniref:monocarboxylate transporter 2-like n=1 Tax=Anneissia japonica TaxID=1529436 RepID=UPI00142585EE|nr:monocarboxylate transporter 2-like [Anneissia japonica]